MRIKRGVTIIETMIALFILALMGGAIVSLTLQILAANNSAKLKNKAAAYVQQALEQVRGFYQGSSWLALSQKNNIQCYQDGTIGTANITCIPINFTCDNSAGFNFDSNFYRSVSVVTAAPKITVTAIVAWSDRGQCRQTSETTYYYNY